MDSKERNLNEKTYIIVFLLVSLLVSGCSSSNEINETFIWPDKEVVSEVKYEEKTISSKKYKRNFYVNLVYDIDTLIRQEVVEEYYFNDDMENELETTKTSFEQLEQQESFKHKGVSFDYLIKEKYFKVIITIDHRQIRKDNVRGFLLDYIGGEDVFNKKGIVSYEKLKDKLLEIGFVQFK